MGSGFVDHSPLIFKFSLEIPVVTKHQIEESKLFIETQTKA